MDGVLCNFQKVYHSVNLPNTPKKFRHCVAHLKIFENLEWMPSGRKLLEFLDTLGVEIQILSSRGTHDDVIGGEGIRQKELWLDKNGITYKRNFVKIGIDKRNYSNKGTILIDDTPKVVESFNSGAGIALLYEDAKFKEMKIELLKHFT